MYIYIHFSYSELLWLHNMFIFFTVRYIKNVDGFTGCYRGLLPKIIAQSISAIAFEKSYKSVEFEDEPDDNVPTDDLEDSER